LELAAEVELCTCVSITVVDFGITREMPPLLPRMH
jgi:hypothetical protein